MRIWVSLALVAAGASCGDAGLPSVEPLPPPTDFVLTGATQPTPPPATKRVK